MDDRTEPSICIVAPIGSTMSETSSGTPISLHAFLFTGIVATELCVAKAVIAGGSIFENIL